MENAFFRVGGILFAEKSRWKLGKNDGLLGSFQAWNDGCFSRKDRLETVRRQTHCVFFLLGKETSKDRVYEDDLTDIDGCHFQMP